MVARRIAFVTGGAEGIGACTTEMLCSRGYTVIFCDIDEEKGRERERIIQEKRMEGAFVKCDVSSADQVKRASEKVLDRYGQIDAVINNAGIADPAMEFPSDDTEKWDRVIGTNLTGVYNVSNYFVPLMKPGSSVVNIASTRAFQSEPNTPAYSASKGGVVALTHSIAITLSQKRIRVNCISPGWIDTSGWKIPAEKSDLKRIDHLQHPSGRAGRPEDVANLVAFLCSEEGNWINGQNITLDGGMTRRMIYFDEDVLAEIRRYKDLE